MSYLFKLGSEYRSGSNNMYRKLQGRGGTCPGSTVLVGATVLVGPSELALPSASIVSIVFHCGYANWTSTNGSWGGSGTRPDSGPGGGSANTNAPPRGDVTHSTGGRGSKGVAVGAAVGSVLGVTAVAGLALLVLLLHRRKQRGGRGAGDAEKQPGAHALPALQHIPASALFQWPMGANGASHPVSASQTGTGSSECSSQTHSTPQPWPTQGSSAGHSSGAGGQVLHPIAEAPATPAITSSQPAGSPAASLPWGTSRPSSRTAGFAAPAEAVASASNNLLLQPGSLAPRFSGPVPTYCGSSPAKATPWLASSTAMASAPAAAPRPAVAKFSRLSAVKGEDANQLQGSELVLWEAAATGGRQGMAPDTHSLELSLQEKERSTEVPRVLRSGSHTVQLGSLLSTGASALVFTGQCAEHGVVAVKVFTAAAVGTKEGEGGDKPPQHSHNAREELRLMQQLDHPHVVRCLWGSCTRTGGSGGGGEETGAKGEEMRPVGRCAGAGAQQDGRSRSAGQLAAGACAGPAAAARVGDTPIPVPCTRPESVAIDINADNTAPAHTTHTPPPAQSATQALAAAPSAQQPCSVGSQQPSFMVLELADSDLAAAVHGQKIRLGRALQACAQVAGALAYLHSRGVAHGDIKPANVLLAQGCARLCDFGLARPCRRVPVVIDLEDGLLEPGASYISVEAADIIRGQGLNKEVGWEGGAEALHRSCQRDIEAEPAGTVAYLAPECFGPLRQSGAGGRSRAPPTHAYPAHKAEITAAAATAGSAEATVAVATRQQHKDGAAQGSSSQLQVDGAAADVYALGVMLGEVVTRTKPWAGMLTPGIICCVGVMRQTPYPLLVAREGLPPDLPALVRSCCAWDPAQRPPAAQVALALLRMARVQAR